MIELGLTKDGRVTGIPLALANRHGLVTGATGTGKTVTLQRMAEAFSRAGVPVFAADIKGDLSGIASAGQPTGKLADAAARLGISWSPERFPVRFWDLYKEEGIPIRTTVQELGVPLLARLLDLNQTQEGVLQVLDKWRDDNASAGRGFMVHLKDAQAIYRDATWYMPEIREKFGHVTGASIATVQRALLTLEAENGWRLFGEPVLDVRDLMQTDERGYGMINLLTADRLMNVPRMYGIFLLHLLRTLFDVLPEVGDLDKPKMVFFFDEAHLLFSTAPPKLLEIIERTVRLIRSKGVGVYFVTQSSRDVPETVLAQLGHKVQHALRAFTPKEIAALRQISAGFRPNPAMLPPGTHPARVVKESIAAVSDAITTMGVGEALVSFLDSSGTASPVERVRILPPEGQVGPITEAQRVGILDSDPLKAKYWNESENQDAAYCARLHPELAHVHDKRHGMSPEYSAMVDRFIAEQEIVLAKRAEEKATPAPAAPSGPGVSVWNQIKDMFFSAFMPPPADRR